MRTSFSLAALGALALAFTTPAAAQSFPISLGGWDGAPTDFRGTYSLSISAVATVTVTTPGVYQLAGSLQLINGASYSASPTCSSVTLDVAGQTLVSDGGFALDPDPPAGWTFTYTINWAYWTRPVQQGIYLPAGVHNVRLQVTGFVERAHQYHGAGLWASFSGSLSAVVPSIQLTGPSQVCAGTPVQMTYLGAPPGGVVSNWRVFPATNAVVSGSGVLTGLVPNQTVFVQADYTFPGWGGLVPSAPFAVFVAPPPTITAMVSPNPPRLGSTVTVTAAATPPGGTLTVTSPTPGFVVPPVTGTSLSFVMDVPSVVLVLTYTTPACPGVATTALALFALPPLEPPLVPERPDMPEPAADDASGAGEEKAPPCSVILHNGEQRLDRVDLAVPGRGDCQFVFKRRYRSRIRWEGPLGANWDHDYAERLVIEDDGDVFRINGGARADLWRHLGDGRYDAPRGYFSTLVRRADGTFVLRERTGKKHVYGADGRLQAHVDRHGNRLLFEHDAEGRLVRVLDAYDRTYTFAYEGARLVSLRDFAGREVVYTYDAQGDLVAVRSPVVTGTSTGNDFPAGRTEQFVYSSGFAQEELNHNLIAVVRPEEVATGGPPFLQWTYGTDPSAPDSYDRVLTQLEGGVNASGVSAGGTLTFTFVAAQDEASRLTTVSIATATRPSTSSTPRASASSSAGSRAASARASRRRSRCAPRTTPTATWSGASSPPATRSR